MQQTNVSSADQNIPVLMEAARMPLSVHTCLSTPDQYPAHSLMSCIFKALLSSSYLCRAMVQAVCRRESLGSDPSPCGTCGGGSVQWGRFVYHHSGFACQLFFHQCSIFILQSFDVDQIGTLGTLVPRGLVLLQPKN